MVSVLVSAGGFTSSKNEINSLKSKHTTTTHKNDNQSCSRQNKKSVPQNSPVRSSCTKTDHFKKRSVSSSYYYIESWRRRWSTYQTPFLSDPKSIGLQSNPPATNLVSDKNRTCKSGSIIRGKISFPVLISTFNGLMFQGVGKSPLQLWHLDMIWRTFQTIPTSRLDWNSLYRGAQNKIHEGECHETIFPEVVRLISNQTGSIKTSDRFNHNIER